MDYATVHPICIIQDSRAISARWANGEGINVALHRYSTRRWPTKDRIGLVQSVDEYYVDEYKRKPIQMEWVLLID